MTHHLVSCHQRDVFPTCTCWKVIDMSFYIWRLVIVDGNLLDAHCTRTVACRQVYTMLAFDREGGTGTSLSYPSQSDPHNTNSRSYPTHVSQDEHHCKEISGICLLWMPFASQVAAGGFDHGTCIRDGFTVLGLCLPPLNLQVLGEIWDGLLLMLRFQHWMTAKRCK